MPDQERLTPRGTLGFLRRLGPRVRPYGTPLLVAGVLMLGSVGIGLAFPLVVRELLDAWDIEIEKTKSHYVVTANYETRVALIANIDVVLKFENNKIELPLQR